jgi:hypothetical protein
MLAVVDLREGAKPPALPAARGDLTSALFHALARRPGPVVLPPVTSSDVLVDEDLQLALYCCYELHYRGFAEVDEAWEWHPALLALRAELEAHLEAGLRDLVGFHPPAADVAACLWELATTGDGPSLSGWVLEQATLDQVRQLAIHRSAYQLKEADPHTWVIPRLAGRAKATVVTIQHDEYGAGRAGQSHAELFAATMRALDLDSSYGAYLDRIPGYTLATTNLISWLGLHRRLRGALVGHLALFEMTSVGPMGRYSAALERLGIAAAGRRFYDVHVEADAVHQHLAVEGMVGGLLEDEPHLAPDVLFGARAVSAVERTFATRILDAWQHGDSSLLA